MVATTTSQFGGHVARSIEPGYLVIFRRQADALACAEQVCKSVAPELAQRIAIDCGDVWRVMRAHGNDYCGKTVTRCRELLKQAKPGKVTMTVFFADALPRPQYVRIGSRGDDHFTFEKKTIRIFELRGWTQTKKLLPATANKPGFSGTQFVGLYDVPQNPKKGASLDEPPPDKLTARLFARDFSETFLGLKSSP
jgi:class 3 adenylate cyclase